MTPEGQENATSREPAYVKEPDTSADKAHAIWLIPSKAEVTVSKRLYVDKDMSSA